VLAQILVGMALAFPNVAAPGAFVAYLVGLVSQRGWRRTWYLCFVPLITDGPIIALLVFVLAQAPPVFLGVLQIVGGFFLMWLGLQTLQAFINPANPSTAQHPSSPKPTNRSVLHSLLMNLINPGPWIFWGTIGAVRLVQLWRESAANAAGLLIGFYAVLCSGLLFWISLFASASKLNPRAPRLLRLLAALALLLLGASTLRAGVTPFV
jgi:threonine/homoserine/homoserine lactone efflux protein